MSSSIRYAIILNPVSGKGKGGKYRSRIEDYLTRRGIDFELFITEYPGHAAELARMVSDERFNALISVGGDGTLNEVVNGLGAGREIKLGVISTGSGNDFVQNFDNPGDFSYQLEYLFSESIVSIPVDLGRVEFIDGSSDKLRTHYFINNLGIGFDAHVAHINRFEKKFSGTFSYVLAVFKALKNLKYLLVELEIEQNSINVDESVLLLTIGNGKRSGGGFYLTPDADLHDGIFDITMITRVTKPRLLMKLPMALFNKIKTIPEVRLYKGKEISIKLNFPYYVHTDGEILSERADRLRIELIPKGINVIRSGK